MKNRSAYLAACAIGLLGLAPYVVLSTATVPLQKPMLAALGGGPVGIALSGGLSTGAYAVGAVLTAQIALRRKQRGIFLVAEAVFVVATVVAAVAPTVLVLIIARTVQGLAAGAMLTSSLPPLITRFGAARVPLSAGVVDVGIFGASTLGPLAGSVAAHGSGWRWLFAAAAALGAIGWVVAYRGYESWDPPAPERRTDAAALTLVVAVCAPVFVASSLVGSHPLLSWQVLGLLLVGAAALALLLVVESRRDEPLIPVDALSTQLPVSGILAAAVGGAVFVTIVEVVQSGRVPGSWWWPMPVGAAIGAIALWRLFATRLLPLLVDAGMCAMGAAGLLLLAGQGRTNVLLAALLLGVGAAATVSPGLFLTGLGLPSDRLARAFALVQLLRALATYAVAPIVLQVVVKKGASSGPQHAYLAMTVVAAVGLVLLIVVPFLSGARLHAPDIEAWLDGGQGLPSPATAAHLRPSVDDEEAHELVPSPARSPHRRHWGLLRSRRPVPRSARHRG